MRRWRRFLPLSISILALFFFTYLRRRMPATWATTIPDELPLAGHERLLILAPHCDDETLGCAGLILAARRLGLEVRVVIATNGDGYLFATMEEFRRVYPRYADFIRMGTVRQQESLRALALLDVAADQVSFLSYPDRGLAAFWNDHWSVAAPYRSPYSGLTRSVYPLTYNPNSVYAGEDLLADLCSILRSYHPDLIVYPHPNDMHPDHWALSAFTRLTLALIEREDADYRPATYVYLIHRPAFPLPKGLRVQHGLFPPVALYNVTPHWLRLDLSREDVKLKWQAIYAYRSQLFFIRELLESFIRTNELFAEREPALLPRLADGNPLNPETWRDMDNHPVQPVQVDPIGDFIVTRALAPADLVALYAGESRDNSLAACIQVRGRVTPTQRYLLRIMAVTPHGITHHVARRNYFFQRSSPSAYVNGCYVCTQVPLSQLGNPALLFVGAEVQGAQVGVLDQTAWQLLLRAE